MDKKHDNAIRDALLDFCRKKKWTNPQAVTLTLKLARQVGTTWVRLTEIDAQRNLRHVLNVLRKKLRRYGFPKTAELQCVPVLEGTDVVRPHFHLMLDRPACIEPEEYAALIAYEWSRTHWGHQLTKVEPCHNEIGWLNYISKSRTKSDYAAAIDWTNFR